MISCETDDQAQNRVKSAIKLVGNELLTLKVLVSSEKMRKFAIYDSCSLNRCFIAF